LEITECWWTYNGQKVGNDVDTALCSWMFNGTSGSGNWLVFKIEIFKDAGGTNLIGRQWVEGRGTYALISNQLPNRPIYARWAKNTPGAKIPIQDINDSLGGFGAFGPITTLPIESPTVSQWGLIVLAVALLATGIIVAVRRKQVAA
jgi:hypothetical protein